MQKETGLASAGGGAVSLKSVHIDGTLNGLMLHVTTRQCYVNKSRRNIEAVYTFPLPSHAVLLGTRLTIGDKTLTAMVMEKSDAEDDYEEAIQDGDLPVMIERSGPGLYTANLGNLKRGEEVSIEVQWAQLQNVRDSSVRVAIPTVIGARYGDAHAIGGLAPHQSDEVDILAEYPLTMTLAIEGEIAKSNINCASHAAQISNSNATENPQQVVSIISDAYMDRDVVITLSDLQTTHFGLAQVGEQGPATLLASFCPQLPTTASPLALKILVDCSGSMEGDSIEQARQAVHQVMQQLNDRDYVSYSRFGNLVAHNFNRPVQANEKRRLTPETMLPATDKKIANIGRLIRSTKADLGGTELEMAAVSTIHDLRLPAEVGAQAFIPTLLLITDGDVWNHEGVVRAAKNSGHRIFAIGVGSAPAESLLRELAETTGGVCEFVSPNESMGEAALRLVKRMRTATAAQLSINWGATPTWQSVLPTTVFDGETLHVFATFDSLPANLPVLSAALDSEKVSVPLPRVDRGAENLDRMAAAQRLLAESPEAALQTALQFSLVTQQTNMLLVHVREADDKATELPKLEQVKQMMAAGHSGYGTARSSGVLYCLNAHDPNTVRFSRGISDNDIPPARMSQPLWLRKPKSTSSANSSSMQDVGMDQISIPDFMRRKAMGDDAHEQATPQHFVAMFNKVALEMTSLHDALNFVLNSLHGTNLRTIIDALYDHTGDESSAVAILLLWVSETMQLEGCRLQRHAQRLLDAGIDHELTPEAIKSGNAYLMKNFGGITKDNWYSDATQTA